MAFILSPVISTDDVGPQRFTLLIKSPSIKRVLTSRQRDCAEKESSVSKDLSLLSAAFRKMWTCRCVSLMLID